MGNKKEYMKEKGEEVVDSKDYMKSKDPCAVFWGFSMGVSSVALGDRDRGSAIWV